MSLQRAVERVAKGDPRKRSRFHDFSGNRVPLRGLLNLPRCLASTLRVKLLGSFPAVPWLSFDAVRRLEGLIEPTWHVLEMGSGNSTRWLAKRCAHLFSVESDSQWLASVRGWLGDPPNVDLILAEPPYAPLHRELPRRFDLALVDGIDRQSGMELALAKVRPGGWVYLDNADVLDEGHQRARALLLEAADDGSVERFIDFSPGQLTVSQGLLARLRN